MNAPLQHALTWAPRVLLLLFAAFLALFGLDAFSEGGPFLTMLLSGVMHLVPSLLVLLVLAVAWFHPRLGAAGAAALAIWYLASMGNLHWSNGVIIAGPLLLVAALLLVPPRQAAAGRRSGVSST